jgi:glutamate-1-semialdehyde aminotransferase
MGSKSEELFARALRTIPWGTQTNSKRPKPALAGVMPAFIERGQGCRVYDVDGNEYIDYRAALGPILLGYCYPAVDRAVAAQLAKGVIFSMASPVEIEVAEAIAALLPWAEKVRFTKTGADASSAALRIARAYTGRAKFLSCSYHGWHDQFAAAAQGIGRGVPEVLNEYVYSIPYGDAAAAERILAEQGADIAAIFTVPYDLGPHPSDAFLRRLRELATAHGALLIFDEIVTGFRLAKGGGAEYFGVEPDLVVVAKALANGFPLAAFCGKREVMAVLDTDQVLITTTYAGETLSLAASVATLAILRDEPVIEHIWRLGQRLMQGLEQAGRDAGLPVRVYGLPPCSTLAFDVEDAAAQNQLRDHFFGELFRQGIFPNVNWFITYSHTQADIDETIEKAKTAFHRIASLAADGHR